MSGRHGKKRDRQKKKHDPTTSPNKIQPTEQVAQTAPPQNFPTSDTQSDPTIMHTKIFGKPDPFDLALYGLILTAIIAAIYYLQLRSMQAQQKSMQEQVIEAQKQTAEIQRQTEISERPWLAVDVSPDSDLMFPNGQPTVGIKFSFRNLGKTIAKDIWVSAKMAAEQPGLPVSVDASSRQSEICSHPQPDPVGRLDLFPGEVPKERITGVGPTKAEFEALAVPSVDNASRRFAGLSIVGCANYRSSFNNRLHQTFFAFRVMQPTARLQNGHIIKLTNGMFPFGDFEEETQVPKKKITLLPEVLARNDAD